MPRGYGFGGEIMRGKSISRTLINLRVNGTKLTGAGIDLGSKDGSASQYRFLEIDGTVEYTDLRPEREDVWAIDLEKPFPVSDQSQDFLMLFHVLEHLYDYRACIRESFRILKPGGMLIGAVPFLERIHPDPDDHFRYTKSTLTRMFSEAGFSPVMVEPIGRGPFTIAAHMIHGLVPTPPLKWVNAMVGVALDGALRRLSRKDWGPVYAIAYYFELEKPSAPKPSPIQ